MDTEAADRPTSPLISQIEEQTRDLEWTLAHFSFVANVTSLASACDIAHSPAMSVASCLNLSQPALAFMGESPELLANYATFLADPGSEIDLLVNDEQRAVVRQAFEVLEERLMWQMVFCGDIAELDAGEAEALTEDDWSAVQSLARSEKVELEIFGKSPYEHGPLFGLWDHKKLVAVGMTLLHIPGAAQIGNFVVRKDRQKGACFEQIVAALVAALTEASLCAFTIVPQKDDAFAKRLEALGFERRRAMYLMHCVIGEEPEPPAAADDL